ncbi:MAG: hypothetical protein AAFV53_36510 [Myxococcota bacterium]
MAPTENRLLDHLKQIVGDVDLSRSPEPDDDRSATASVLKPRFADDYYREQSDLYFDTLVSKAPIRQHPKYAHGVVRWEWPPWLLLTGKGRDNMLAIDVLLKAYPTWCVDRKYRVYDTQPFGRAQVTFHYGHPDARPVPIYEEFTFNDAGEQTFIEAWSLDDPSLGPRDADGWPTGPITRMGLRIPGLGSRTSAIDMPALRAEAAHDPDLAVFLKCYTHPFFEWTDHLMQSIFTKDGTHPDIPHNTLVHRILAARQAATAPIS